MKFFTKSNKTIYWGNVILIIVFHLMTLIGLVIFPYIIKWKTLLWGLFIGGVGGFGVTAGVHRLWSHKSYKATMVLRIILMLCYAVAGQNDIFKWVRDHRLHHKFSETDSDPHNAKRGFFFSHVGWLMMKKHPNVIEKGQSLDMSDVLADPVVKFSIKNFLWLKLLMCFILPSIIPHLIWNETWFWSIYSQAVCRYIISLNFTWLVNSVAHIWGNKPYDRNIGPSENTIVSILSIGEGYHNYHHTFPWDYRAAELGKYSITTLWINIFATIGWAYDLKKPSNDLVKKVISKRGDGSHTERNYLT